MICWLLKKVHIFNEEIRGKRFEKMEIRKMEGQFVLNLLSPPFPLHPQHQRNDVRIGGVVGGQVGKGIIYLQAAKLQPYAYTWPGGKPFNGIKAGFYLELVDACAYENGFPEIQLYT